MLKLISSRLITTVPLLLFISILVFLMVHLVPGSVAEIILGEGATPENVAELEESLANMRCAFRDHLRVATFRGWGPRFLHSIGQLYKGGPPRGHFLIITDRPQDDLPIPGRPFSAIQ